MSFTKTKVNNFNELNINKLNSQLSFIHLNIRSLRKNFTTFISQINSIISKTHLIFLTETNITDEENNLYNMRGFNSIFLNREGRGGGVAVYIKESINFKTTYINTDSYETLRIDIIKNNKTTTIIPIYRPPSQNVNTFTNELDQALSKINKKNETIIIGDMNIDIKRTNITTTKYLDMLSSYGLQCMVTETTREDEKNKTNTCIDHLFVRCRRTQAHAVVVTTTISDHYSVFGYVEEIKKTKESIVIGCQGSDNTKINTKKVNNCINETDWDGIINKSNNTNELFSNIYKVFCNIYERTKELNIKIQKRKDYPWLSNVILQCCEIRDKLHKKWCKNKDNKTNETLYKKFNNNLNKKIIFAKNTYNMRQFIMNRNNLRIVWQLINEIIGKKPNSNSIDKTIVKSFPDETVPEITEKFADKFGENVNKIIHNCAIKTIQTTESNVENSMYIEYSTEEEIYNILKNLNARKSPGADGIRACDLKNNAVRLTPVITALINSSLSEATIPTLLKTSLVRPIYKSGVKSDHNNYRPISILPVIEKVLEEIVVRRLNEFLRKYNILHKSQYGFQKGKNINQLLGLFANEVNKNLAENKCCLALFIDFSKAFDTLPHNKIIETLERNGVRGQCIEWFKSYLECRTFKVKIENSVSESKPSRYGVPQGSKLGPILYIIYANDLIKTLKNSTTYAYADDTAIVVAHESIERASVTMQNEFTIIIKWCHDNGLVINAEKTKLMHFRPRHIPRTSITPIFHNTQCLHRNSTNDNCSTKVELVETYKYLGVYLDEHFKWKTHTETLHKKLRQSAYALYHLSICTPHNVLRQAYFALAESYLRHGITAWGTATYCRTLQKVQDKLIKLLYRNKLKNDNHNNSINTINTQSNTQSNAQLSRQIECATRSTKQNIPSQIKLRKDLQILNIKDIYKTTIIAEFYNNTDILHRIDHQKNTRSKTQGLFKIPQFRNNYGKNSLNVSLPTTINKIPQTILKTNNKIKRNKLIKKHLLSIN